MLLAIAYMNFIDKENKFELQNNGRNKTKAHTINGSIQIANFRFFVDKTTLRHHLIKIEN